MATTLYEMAFATVIQAFPQSRRTAITTLTLAGALASTVFTPLSGSVFDTFGWREGLVALAITLSTVIPLFLTLPAAAPDPVLSSGAGPSDTREIDRASQMQAFWTMGVAFTLASVVSVSMNTYAVAFMLDRYPRWRRLQPRWPLAYLSAAWASMAPGSLWQW